MIIAVGFKVNNQRAVQFRKWAGQIVKDHTIQGWTMDVEHLKKGHMFTDKYFEWQLQQIREIRLSERKFYQKVTNLYATAFDYDKDAANSKNVVSFLGFSFDGKRFLYVQRQRSNTIIGCIARQKL